MQYYLLLMIFIITITMDYTLTKLNLSNKKLTELPTNIHKFLNLIELDCKFNKLIRLDNLPKSPMLA